MAKSIIENTVSADNDSHILENCIPHCLIGPAVDVILACKKSGLVCWKIDCYGAEMLVTERDSGGEEPD